MRIVEDDGSGRFSIKALVEEYLIHVRAKYRPKTAERAAYSLQKFLAYCEASGIRSVKALDRRRIRMFSIGLKDAGYADETVWGIASTVRSFFNWCVNEGILDESPIKPGDMPVKPTPKPQPLTEDQLHKVLNACDEPGWIGDRNYAIVYTLAFTGMRRGELMQMRVGDLERGYTIVRGKGDQQRAIYLPHSVIVIIRKYLLRLRLERNVQLDDEDPLWWGWYLRPMTDESVRRMLDRLGKKVGIDLYAHRLRDTCATLLIKNNTPTEVVKELLGHKDLRSIASYTKLSREDVGRIVEQNHPLNRMDTSRRRRKRSSGG